MKNNLRILPLFIIFLISVSINIYFFQSGIVQDDTASKIIEDSFKNINLEQDFLKEPLDNNDFYLLFDEMQLTTKNFINIFSAFNNEKLKIKKVYPYINPIHEDDLRSKLSELTFKSDNINTELNLLTDKYINVLNGYGLDDEIDKVNRYGVYFRVVLVYTSNKEMYNFLNKYPNIKYSMTLDGNYKRLATS